MNSGLTPEEKARIVEEQRIRNKENMKTGFKTIGTFYLVIGGVALVFFCCLCLCLIAFFIFWSASLGNSYGY